MEKRNDLREKSQEIINLFKDNSLEKIAKKFTCSIHLISDILKENKVDTSRSGRKRPDASERMKGNKYGEIKRTKLDEKEVIRLYTQENKHTPEISKIFNCNPSVIYEVLKRNNILRVPFKNHTEEDRIKMSAIKQGIPLEQWKGFTQPIFYKNFTPKFKKLIKERDGICMLCNIGFDDLKSLKRKIHIHHINYDKLLSVPENCISLCISCHNKTKFNKNQWITFFQSLLSERYNYQYSENREIILSLGVKL